MNFVYDCASKLVGRCIQIASPNLMTPRPDSFALATGLRLQGIRRTYGSAGAVKKDQRMGQYLAMVVHHLMSMKGALHGHSTPFEAT